LGKKRKKINLEREITFALFVIPVFLLYTMYFILPLIIGAYYSFTDWSGTSPQANFVGFSNYVELATDRVFRQALWFNIWYAVLLVIITIILSTVLSLCLNAKIRLKTFFRGALFYLAVLSMLTVGKVFGEIYTRAIPTAARSLDIEYFQISVLSRVETAPFGLMFVHVWQGLAIPTVLLLAGLQTIPEEINESAALDGANAWHRFWRITVPYLIPTINVVLVLTLRSGLIMFDYVMAMTEGGPAGATRSLSYLIYSLSFRELRFGYANAQAMVVSIILMVVSYIQILSLRKRRVHLDG